MITQSKNQSINQSSSKELLIKNSSLSNQNQSNQRINFDCLTCILKVKPD